MTEIFTWTPQAGPTGTITHRAKVAQFGDGYSQAAADGINARSETWPVSFTGDATYAGAIRTFLDARGAYQSFFWTPPGGSQGYYRCQQHEVTAIGTGLYTLTATFQQVFQP